MAIVLVVSAFPLIGYWYCVYCIYSLFYIVFLFQKKRKNWFSRYKSNNHTAYQSNIKCNFTNFVGSEKGKVPSSKGTLSDSMVCSEASEVLLLML